MILYDPLIVHEFSVCDLFGDSLRLIWRQSATYLETVCDLFGDSLRLIWRQSATDWQWPKAKYLKSDGGEVCQSL